MIDEPYPEHVKMQKARDELGTQKIGDFLEWLDHTGRYVCERREYETMGGLQTSELMPVRESVRDLLAEYADIDLDKIETEKRAMLAAMRGDNG